MNNSSNIMRPKDVARLLGISSTSLWRLEKIDPEFPKKIRYSSRCVGFSVSDIENYLDLKKGQKSVANNLDGRKSYILIEPNKGLFDGWYSNREAAYESRDFKQREYKDEKWIVLESGYPFDISHEIRLVFHTAGRKIKNKQ